MNHNGDLLAVIEGSWIRAVDPAPVEVADVRDLYFKCIFPNDRDQETFDNAVLLVSGKSTLPDS